jgi:DNA (cytosine-5)-methyltransferase 1
MLLDGKRPDGLIGGPPCQGFSSIGKRELRDPRNTLISQFYRHVALLRPKFFLMENVEGILHEQNRPLLDAALETLPSHYVVVGPISVNAGDYGAATRRRRVVVFGYDPAEFPFTTEEDFRPLTLSTATVRDAIADLPKPISQSKDSANFGWAQYPETTSSLHPYAAAARQAPPPDLGSAEGRERHKHGFVSGLFETVHSDAIHTRYLGVAGGRSDPITKSYKLEWDGQCPTLRAGTGSERGAFQAVRPLHPDEGRVISVREAARLQGFPDWFEFHPTKWQSFRMIGNSVSPYVSLGLMKPIARKLQVDKAA